MTLLTQELESKLRSNSKANKNGGKSFPFVVKLFNPYGSGTWYLSELDDNDIAFGRCDLGHGAELGYISLQELRDYRSPLGGRIERDRYWNGEVQ